MAIPFIIAGVAAVATVAYFSSGDDDDEPEEERSVRYKAEKKRNKKIKKEEKRQKKQNERELKDYSINKLQALSIKYDLDLNNIEDLAERAIENIDFSEEKLLLLYDNSDRQMSTKKKIIELRKKIQLIDTLYNQL